MAQKNSNSKGLLVSPFSQYWRKVEEQLQLEFPEQDMIVLTEEAFADLLTKLEIDYEPLPVAWTFRAAGVAKIDNERIILYPERKVVSPSDNGRPAQWQMSEIEAERLIAHCRQTLDEQGGCVSEKEARRLLRDLFFQTFGA